MHLRPTQLGGKSVRKLRRTNPYLVKSVSRIRPVAPRTPSTRAGPQELDTTLRQKHLGHDDSSSSAALEREHSTSRAAETPCSTVPDGPAIAVHQDMPDTASVTRLSAQLEALPLEHKPTAQLTQDGPYNTVTSEKILQPIGTSRSDTAQVRDFLVACVIHGTQNRDLMNSASVKSIYRCQFVKIVNTFEGDHVMVNRYCQQLPTCERVIHVNNICVKMSTSGPYGSIWLSRRNKH
jgi:hypothetical protein